MTRTRRGLVFAGALVVVMAATAAANAVRSVFAEPGPTPQDATIESGTARVIPGPAVVISIPPVSPSLDEVDRQGLSPQDWQWFSDVVATPSDALAGGADLVAAMKGVPALAELKVLSAQALAFPDEEDLGWRGAWLKVSDHELLRVITQRLPADSVIPAVDGTRVSYANGEAVTTSKPGQLSVILVVADQMAIVRLQAVDPLGAEYPAMTHSDLLEIAAGIIAAYQH